MQTSGQTAHPPARRTRPRPRWRPGSSGPASESMPRNRPHASSTRQRRQTRRQRAHRGRGSARPRRVSPAAPCTGAAWLPLPTPSSAPRSPRSLTPQRRQQQLSSTAPALPAIAPAMPRQLSPMCLPGSGHADFGQRHSGQRHQPHPRAAAEPLCAGEPSHCAATVLAGSRSGRGEVRRAPLTQRRTPSAANALDCVFLSFSKFRGGVAPSSNGCNKQRVTPHVQRSTHRRLPARRRTKHWTPQRRRSGVRGMCILKRGLRAPVDGASSVSREWVPHAPVSA